MNLNEPIYIKDWKFSLKEGKDHNFLFLENTKTGFCDYPILHDDCVTYDRPERVPKYVKHKIDIQFASHFGFYRMMNRLTN